MIREVRHNCLPMDDPSVLADVNRWVGVAIALVGSVVIAPSGTVLLWRSATDWMRQRKHHLRGHLARFLPFLRRDVNIHVSSVSGMASGAVNVTLTASGRVWQPSASVDERIEALRKHITEVDGRLNDVARKLGEETTDRQRVFGELHRTLEEKTAELRRMLEEKERESARVDARGLPVVGLGILLSGVPRSWRRFLSA
jgi:hypothetical protein